MSNTEIWTMESAALTQIYDVPLPLLVGSKRQLYIDLARASECLLSTCFVEAGDETGSPPIVYTANPWQEFGGSPNLLDECISMIMKARDAYFRGLAEIEAGAEAASPRAEFYEEIDVLASSLTLISGVEELKVQETKTGFEIWIVINNASEEGRYAIYDAEWELMRRFPGRIFDFHLIDREEMDLSSIVTFSDGTLTIPIGRRDYAQ